MGEYLTDTVAYTHCYLTENWNIVSAHYPEVFRLVYEITQKLQ